MLLNFWGDWCAPCVAEIPDLVEAGRRYADHDLEIVSFLLAEDPDHAHAILEARHATWPQIPYTDDCAKRFRIRSFPTNILIFPDGKTTRTAFSVDQAFFAAALK